MEEILLTWGVQSAITGLFFWLIKRGISKRDQKSEEREKNYEKMMLMMMQTGRANHVLARATAVAVQRIPDAKCNGDMKKALKEADEIQGQEHKFLIDHGVKHIFGD